jgi:arylformamidase
MGMMIDIDAEYNNRSRVPGYPEIFARWARDAAAWRNSSTCEIGVPYGTGARHIIDIFHPEVDDGRPIISFIHGGYWRALDPRMFSHMARGLTARGFIVAMPGYDLCPQVSIADIIAQMQAAHVMLWRRFARPIIASGHSAGGHLAACLLATDWTIGNASLPDNLVPAAYAISGLFDLSPLVQTVINDDLRLDELSAKAASPQFWPAPQKRMFDAVVGAQESSAFIHQSRTIADVWGRAGTITRWGSVPTANHFTLLDPLTQPASAMATRIAHMALQNRF